MGTARRIPLKNNDFDTYIRTTANALLAGTPATWVRLGLTPEQAAKWEELHTQWVDNWAAFISTDRRTKTVTDIKKQLMREFTRFASPILTSMSVHPATTHGDRLTFNIPGAERPYTRRGDIGETPLADIRPKGGALLVARVRRMHDGGRASMHPLADFIEVRYALCDLNGPFPNSARECPEVVLSTRTYFHITVDQAAIGKRLVAYVRWANARKAENNGPWTDAIRAVVA